jgi:hypothetical protein
MKNVKKVLLGMLAALSLVAVVGGCGNSGGGGGDFIANCGKACDKAAMCFMIDAAMCKSQSCTQQAADAENLCKNAGARATAASGCLNMACADYATCLQGVPACTTM